MAGDEGRGGSVVNDGGEGRGGSVVNGVTCTDCSCLPTRWR